MLQLMGAHLSQKKKDTGHFRICFYSILLFLRQVFLYVAQSGLKTPFHLKFFMSSYFSLLLPPVSAGTPGMYCHAWLGRAVRDSRALCQLSYKPSSTV